MPMAGVQRGIRKRTFLKRFRARFLVRFHMALILVATALSGLLASKLLVEAGVAAMAVRYPLAVVLSYLAFFAFVKIWLWHVSRTPGAPGRPGNAANADELPGVLLDVADAASDAASPVPEVIRFGGGRAGGGGAGGVFDAVADVAGGSAGSAPEAAGSAADGAGKAISETGKAAGEVASGLFDVDDGGVALLLLAALIALAAGAGVYLVWQAPSILPEAAFDAALAASLLRGAKRIDAPDWTAGVLRATWKPFLWIVAVTLAFALAAGHYFPHAKRIADLFTPAP